MSDAQKLLNDAAEEIVRLRKTNEHMAIRLTAIDDMLFLAKGQGPRMGGMESGPDIVRQIDEHLNENMDDLSSAVRKSLLKR